MAITPAKQQKWPKQTLAITSAKQPKQMCPNKIAGHSNTVTPLGVGNAWG